MMLPDLEEVRVRAIRFSDLNAFNFNQPSVAGIDRIRKKGLDVLLVD